MHRGKLAGKRDLPLMALLLSALILLQTVGCSAVNQVLSEAKSAVQSVLPTESDVSGAVSTLLGSASSKVPSSASSAHAQEKMQSVEEIAHSSDDDSIRKLSVTKKSAAPGSYGYLSQRNDYQELTAAEKNLYGKIEEAVYQVAAQKNSEGYYPMGRTVASGSVPEEQIRIALLAFLDDNPQVFWVANAYSYGYRNGETILQLYSRLPQSSCNSAIQKLDDKIRSAVSSLPSGLNSFSREENLFHYLTSHCTYSDAAAADESLWQAYTAYGALTEGKAVCEGYSRAMQLLSSYAELPCAVVRGTGQGSPHMWNLIRVNGVWTHLDVTWCDSEIVYYNYYNLTDSAIRQTHTIASSASRLSSSQICAQGSQYNLFLPSCTSNQENYYRIKGIPIQTLANSGDSTMIRVLVPHLEAGETTLVFSIGSNLNFDSAVNGLLSTSPYKMSVYLTKAAAQAGKKLNLNQVTYVKDTTNRGLTIAIAYR